MKNSVVVTVIVAIIIGAIAFYGGVQYEKSKAGGSAGGRGAYSRFAGASAGMTPVRGQIISNSGNSFTVKLSDGSSKIVLLTGSTNIMKSTSGSSSDLTSGKQVLILGTTNSDGSVTAQNVSVNPQGMYRGGGGGGQPASQ